MNIVVNDFITPDLRSKLAALKNRRPLMRAVGEAARRAMQDYYRQLPTNRRGWPSRGFWGKYGANKTRVTAFDQDSATVVVDSVEMGHKYFGGRIKMYDKRLAIPISAEAYRAGSARKFPKPLTLIPRRDKAPLLVSRAPGAIIFEPHFVLVISARHDPDPRAFPPRSKVEPTVWAEINKRTAMILRVSS